MISVRSLHFHESIVDVCNKRKDEWSTAILARLSHVIDLPAAEAIYCQSCSVNFRTGEGYWYSKNATVTIPVNLHEVPNDRELLEDQKTQARLVLLNM
ncbi:hypothetical protein DPMN_187255 [Dreissena polymorpha]|uniref:Uncharacterized protein n=1 Tax=Dreissena polymorpha TaxID=45954 RepID=A0A9D4I8W7_DREPO|nr:hypothetical protein DPMN_187255 [Dreissena polymorpha]